MAMAVAGRAEEAAIVGEVVGGDQTSVVALAADSTSVTMIMMRPAECDIGQEEHTVAWRVWKRSVSQSVSHRLGWLVGWYTAS